MASITIRNLDPQTKARLKVQAAYEGRSMEEQARQILRTAVAQKPAPEPDLATAIRARFEPLGGADLPIPLRQAIRPPPKLGS